MRSIVIGMAVTFALGTLSSSPAFAQAPSPSNPVSQALADAWNGAKRNMLESAHLMPEDGYAFSPTKGVRTFGQILAHVAGANYIFCAAARNVTSPVAEDHFEKTAKTKADILKALEDSVGFCDAAFSGQTDASLGEMVAQPFGSGKGPRAAAIVGNTGHLQEHYGNLVTYFRIKGIVPPSSARQ